MKILSKFFVIAVFFKAGLIFANLYPWHIVDVGYQWPQPIYNASLSFSINKDPGFPSFYYWSHFFVFKNSTAENTRFGYTGLQTVGNVKKAIFSIWNATEAMGRGCQPFVELGTGYQCLIDYNWQQGHTYRVMVSRLMSDSSGDWWGGWVIDNQTGKTENIGLIKSAANSGLIHESWLFHEYFFSVKTCETMPFASIGYSNLLGNFGSVIPLHFLTLPQGHCRNHMRIDFQNNNFTVSTPIVGQK